MRSGRREPAEGIRGSSGRRQGKGEEGRPGERAPYPGGS